MGCGNLVGKAKYIRAMHSIWLPGTGGVGGSKQSDRLIP